MEATVTPVAGAGATVVAVPPPMGRPRLMAPVDFAGGMTGGPVSAVVPPVWICTLVVGETSLVLGTSIPGAVAPTGICPLREPPLTVPSDMPPAVVVIIVPLLDDCGRPLAVNTVVVAPLSEALTVGTGAAGAVLVTVVPAELSK